MADWVDALYRFIYTHLGGQSWTRLLGEAQERSPLSFMLVFLFLGIALERYWARCRWQAIVGFGLGLLAGHLWW